MQMYTNNSPGTPIVTDEVCHDTSLKVTSGIPDELSFSYVYR